MPKKPQTQFIRFNTIKEHINSKLKMRSSDSAVRDFIKGFDTAIKTSLAEACKLAKKDNRNTVLEEDIVPVLEKHLGKKHLPWQETVNEIIKQNPTDLGKISKAINSYIEG